MVTRIFRTSLLVLPLLFASIAPRAIYAITPPDSTIAPGMQLQSDEFADRGFELFYAGPQWFLNALSNPRSRNPFIKSFMFDYNGDRLGAENGYVGTLRDVFDPSLFNNIVTFLGSTGGKTSTSTPLAIAGNDYYWDVNGSASGLGGTGTWDIGVTPNWNDSTGTGTPDVWVNGKNAFFQGTAGTVTLVNGLSANAWNVSVGGYTFSGGDLTVGAGNIAISNTSGTTTVNSLIQGTANLIKTGGGTLVLSNQNTYSGGTTWGNPASQSAAGVISLGSSSTGTTSGPLGTGTFTVRNSGAASNNFIQSSDSTSRTISNPIAFGGGSILFNFGGTGDLTFTGTVNLGTGDRTFTVNNPNTAFSNTISGTGAITKAGTGTLILSGSNLYSGGTTVNAGTLLVNNGIVGSGTGSGVINVNSGGTLGGTGTILAGSNNVTINSGANIMGGTNGSVGTLTLTTNALVISGTYLNDINGATADRITLAGNLVLSGATLDFNTVAAPTAPIYNLLTYTGTRDGTFTVVDPPADYVVQYNPQSIDLVLVPEPSTWIGAALALAAIGFTQRRKLRGLIARRA